MKNAALARLFDTMADVMEIQGENAFRVNTYRRIARTLDDLPEDIQTVHEEGRLTDIPGIGQSSARKIAGYLDTGRMEAYDRLMADFPGGALEMLRIPGLGPKTVGRLMREKAIESIADLGEAIESGALEGMSGLGEKSIENLKAGIEFLQRSAGRVLLGVALPVARELARRLKSECGVERVELAGSLRRMRETVGDVDILAAAPPEDGGRIVQCFSRLDGVAEVLAAGPTKGSVRTEEGLQVDLRVVRPESFGAALVYFTGSKAHNVNIRGRAQAIGLKINEYGVFKGNKRLAGRTEQEVYGSLGLPWILPELREDRGEVEAAEGDDLPDLLTVGDIRGDLHVHSDWSDGALSVREMAKAARAFGYSYVAITDHSRSLTIAGGLSVEELRKRNAEIDEANAGMRGFVILKGSEVDILADGSLDYPDGVLAELDFVVASVHSRFGMPEQEMTRRVITASENPHVDVIGHPTGRILGERDAYAIDMAGVVAACAANGTALELNAHMSRLDITDVVCRQARAAGVKVAINTDAHAAHELPMMALGVGAARRGWLEKGDVLNCMTAARLRRHLKSGD